MKHLLLIFIIASCSNEPDFCIKGKCYEIRETCIESHEELLYFQQIGTNPGITCPVYQTVCDVEIIDTIPFNK